jgi:Domain of unknown function (DUF397)
MEGTSAVTWRTSSYSGGNGGQCVEAGSASGAVLVRDTKQDGRGPVLAFSAGAWRAFAATVKTGTAVLRSMTAPRHPSAGRRGAAACGAGVSRVLTVSAKRAC